VFDWDEHNVEHIARHRVEPEEAEEAILDPRRVGVPAYSTEDERRLGFIGATEAGRVLFVVITRRGPSWRVVTARDATDRARRRYHR
jgi:uncharacterized DUF497 family protein